MKNRPTGIIRTLPSLYGNASVGARRYRRSIAMLESGSLPAIYIALAQKPRQEVLHMYLLIEGEITLRLNIAGYEPGDSRKCWDETIRHPKFWAICTGPVSRPAEPIKRRGFQGFRYTEELWPTENSDFAASYDDYDYDPDDEDDDEEEEFDCHMDQSGFCGKAGSEECDFECPYRDEKL